MKVRRDHTKMIRSVIGAVVGMVGLSLAGGASGGPNDVLSNQQVPAESKALQDQAIDLTDGQGGIQGKYDVVPVRRGELVDEKGGSLDQVVRNRKGETLGTVRKLLKDVKTGKTEYVVLEVEHTKYQLPLQWGQIKQEKGKLILQASKTDLDAANSSAYSKDLSPDLSHYMKEINQVRAHPKPNSKQERGPGVTEAVGPMGESAVGGTGH